MSEHPETIEWSYSFRPSAIAVETMYRLDDECIEWSNRNSRGRIPYEEIEKMHVFKERFLGSSATYWSNVLHLRGGRRVRLGAAYRTGFRRIEDRTSIYIPFIKELEARVERRNRAELIEVGTHWLRRVENAAGWAAVMLLRATRLLGPVRTTELVAVAMRLVGPRLRGHRTARANLAAAFPEKSCREIEDILLLMWDNLGRTIAEIGYLDQVWDYDFVQPRSRRILIDRETHVRLVNLSAEPKPAIFFGAHLANWEIGALFAPALGREIDVLYRTPNIAALARELEKARKGTGVTFVPASAATALKLRRAIARGAWIGMLVDQHYADGVEVTFFGRSCTVHPMVARLACAFECPIYGTRIVRLPGNRFRYELVAIEPPRGPSGRIDVVRTMQLITSIIEGWVREYPEQWLWLHRRWR